MNNAANWPLLCLLIWASCGGDSGGGGTAVDASIQPRPDADPNCSAWRLENVPLFSATLMETLPVHPDRSARIEIEIGHCPDDDLAPTSVLPALDSDFLAVVPRVWRAGNDCDESVRTFRPVVVKFPYAAQWTIATLGDPLVVDVGAAPDIACGASSGGCNLDCDCTNSGEVCLSGTGFAGPISACARPCEFDRDCLGNGTCLVNVADTISHVCELGLDECDATRLCPDGFDCNAGTCEPQFSLNGTTRHACTCDAECDAPLRCAFQPGASEGQCEAVCATNSDGWCEGPHSCDPRASVEDSVAVCGFVGE